MGKSILFERALIKNMLYFGTLQETTSYFNDNYSIKEIGKKAMKNHRIKPFADRNYKITYRDKKL
ncbi:MAG: hypothetical protein QXT72_04800 [Candidatus Micrarchaeia archaeon]